MCFSNLPVEFDEDGNPYLASEAEDVERPDACGCGDDASLDDSDPDAVLEEVLAAVPESVREQVTPSDGERVRPSDGGRVRSSDGEQAPDGREQVTPDGGDITHRDATTDDAWSD